METLTKYINTKFGVDTEIFVDVLKMSPGAEGYLLGSIGELLFKYHMENLGYDALRIKEKPAGGNNAKSDDARGDFYIRKKDSKKDEWFVVECKGVKSNSEKRSNLTKKESVIKLLAKHSYLRAQHVESIYKSGLSSYNLAQDAWLMQNTGTFPEFSWTEINPGAGIPDLSHLWSNEDEIRIWVENFDDSMFSEDAYWDLNAPIRVLQTHMPSTRIDPVTDIKRTGPLVTEFNILCVDLFLKTGKHEFVFANSQQLNHQAKSPNHLQQNYTIDILTEKDEFVRHELLPPWYDSIEQCINETQSIPRQLNKSQLDIR